MDQKLEQAYLYDFYGELLKERQRRIYEDFIFNDLSLGEIAQEEGVSRQAVHDIVRRCDRILQGYEEKLKLIARFESIKGKIACISQLAEQLEAKGTADDGQYCLCGVKIRKLSQEILQEL